MLQCLGNCAIRVSSVLGIFFLLLGCGQKATTPTSPVATAPITDSFKIVKDKNSGKPLLAIRKSALNERFVLHAVLIPQIRATLAESLKSRVVYFRPAGEQLVLHEALDGHVATYDLPRAIPLAVFAIRQESDDSLAIDFNEGMSRVFTANDWFASDFSGADYRPSLAYEYLSLSYIEQMEFAPKNALVIRQIGQVAHPGPSNARENTSAEIRYYLKPYRPDPSYKPVLSQSHRKMGFFEATPVRVLDDDSVIYATRHHPEKPIRFVMSSNTPVEYQQAIRDGVLYWKTVEPSLQIEVGLAPKGVTAPNIEHNVIQWVNVAQFYTAYADAQMDPMTGQIMHAQIYLPSSFALTGVREAHRYLSKGQTEPTSHRGHICSLGQGHFSAPQLIDVLKRGSESAGRTLLRISQDYIRYVVAHEVGHTLGLRHNFGASNAAENYPLTDRRKILSDYAQRDTLPSGLQVVSSVMDYLPTADAALAGASIRHRTANMKYDQRAIATLYKDAEFADRDIPFFCADGERGKFLDCAARDVGTSPVETLQWRVGDLMENIPYIAFNGMASSKATGGLRRPERVDSFAIDPQAVAKLLTAPTADFLGSLKGGSKLLTILREFPFVNTSNEDRVRPREFEYLAREVKNHGGLESVLRPLPIDYPRTMLSEFNKLGSNPALLRGIASNGHSYALDTNDVSAMSALMERIADRLPKFLGTLDVEALEKAPREFKDPAQELSAGFAKVLYQRANRYVMTQVNQMISAEISIPDLAAPKDAAAKTTPRKTVRVDLPVYYYPQELRTRAAALLHSLGSDTAQWAQSERKDIRYNFLRGVNALLQTDLEKLSPDDVQIPNNGRDISELQRRVRAWISENKLVLAQLRL